MRPTSRTLCLSTFVLSNSKPLSHCRSPANPGAPEGATYGCGANGDPCVMGVATAGGAVSECVGARECGAECDHAWSSALGAKREEILVSRGGVDGLVRVPRMVDVRRLETQRVGIEGGVK